MRTCVLAIMFAFAASLSGCQKADRDGDNTPDDNDCWPTVKGGGQIDECDCPENPASPDTCIGSDTDGDTNPPVETDQDGDGYSADDGDCDDADASVNPGAVDGCDGVDSDCDGVIDDDPPDWFFDGDGDGFGDSDSVVNACDAPGDQWVAQDGDCNDDDSLSNPDAAEVCDSADNDCDGDVDEGVTDTYFRDADGDGYGDVDNTADACALPSGYVTDATDCDDADRDAHPGADEVCDGFDNDCDGDVDEASAIDATEWYLDSDEDGHGDGASPDVTSCNEPSGYVASSDDCDDGDATVYPGAVELADGLDNDCSGVIDNDVDADGDGADLVTDEGDTYDCDDADPAVHPGATEICDDGVDNNCDGLTDTGDTSLCYAYSDDDLDGQTELAGDCDDANATVYDGAIELADGLDNDCDGTVDEGTNAYDDDGDGVSEDAGDCDDAESNIHPGAAESDNDIDDDCDTLIDEGTDHDHDGVVEFLTDGVTQVDCDDNDANNSPLETENCVDFQDNDCDGLADSADADCSSVTDADLDGFTPADGDCDDADASINPDATEAADGIDNDCNGVIDDGTVAFDDDGDGFTDTDGDCNDADATVAPDATESCNYVDDDCDGTVDEGCAYIDVDGDGFTPIVDCDDADPSVNPLAAEIAYDGIDQDCSGSDLTDVDGDGYDSDVVGGSDCDDGDASVNPGATEIVDDGVDNNCDGVSLTHNDVDNDGDGFTEDEGDCDDAESSINPVAVELCDDIDNDCDLAIDDGCVYPDVDGDGYSTVLDCDDADATVHPGATEACGNSVDEDCDGVVLDCDDADVDADGESVNEGDCNDADAAVNSSAAESCVDGVDNDCDTKVDYNDTDCSAFVDTDGDGFASSTDCDETDASINPGAAEIPYDGIDQDCDGADLTDQDGDGHDDESVGGDDCDDSDASVSPSASEICGDGIDQDCDGADTVCTDDDGDGFAAIADGGTDCDDAEPTINPDAPEVCGNSIDDDCDLSIDEGCPAVDADGDGYSTVLDCDDADASLNLDDLDGDGYSTCADDCDDTKSRTNPGDVEVCRDGVDNNCDGLTDDADPTEVCVGTIDCADNGVTNDVAITGTVTAGLMSALASAPTEVCVTTWDVGAETCEPFAGDGVEHDFEISRANFTPSADDGVSEEWFNLELWETTGDCQTVQDSDGGYVIQFN